MPVTSVHKFDRRLASLLQGIEKLDIPRQNKKLILDFDRCCVSEGLSLARRLKLVQTVRLIATRYLRKPFREVTQRDIQKAVLAIDSSNLRPWSKRDYKQGIRKFFKFVIRGFDSLNRSGHPKLVEHISLRVRKRDKVTITRSDILTPAEVERLLAAANDTQLRAIVSVMYELGTRVGELGTMTVGSVSRDSSSFLCDLNGKTGPRTVRVILASGALTAWLNAHPERDDPASPLWGCYRAGQWHQLSYSQIENRLKRLAERAGIKKRMHTHLFRHTRYTHLIDSNQMHILQINEYLGLVKDSRQHETYAHITNKSANDAVLRMHGIKPDKVEQALEPRTCGQCRNLNEKGAKFCAVCGNALDLHAADDAASRTEKAAAQVHQYLRQPEVTQDFRQFVRAQIREEIQRQLAHVLRQRSAPQKPPTPKQESSDAGSA